MKQKRIFMALLLSMFLQSITGCATKPYLVSNDFGKKDRSVIDVPKYQPSVIDSRLVMNLHPNDIVIHVELYFHHFESKEMVNFEYDSEQGLLVFSFNMHPKLTLTPDVGEITCNITYLAYNQLYKRNKLLPVHEIHRTKRTILYHPEFKGERKDIPIKYPPGQPLLKGGYPELYTELVSLDGAQIKTIKKALSTDFINRIRSKDIKQYVSTIQSILKMLGK